MTSPAETADRRLPRSWLAGLLLLVGLAAALRCYRNDSRFLSRDEAFSWRLTGYGAADLVRHTAQDVHPPLYYLLLKLWVDALGTSPSLLRGFSALCGTLAAGVAALLCLEACPAGGPARTPARDRAFAALFVAFLVAVHLAQVTPGRTARMYALAALLVGVTSWLLLRALRSPNPALWWAAYGVGVAAFCYTHYYAFFSVLAQALFVAGDLLARWRRTSFRDVLPSALGFLFAGLLAFVLLWPWLPVLHDQVRAVRQSYWIPAVTPRQVERELFSWAAGCDYPGALEARLLLLLLGGILAWTVWRGGRAAWLFFLLAAIPWACALGLSYLSGRPIHLERCLVLAQLGLLVLWGVTWWRLPGALERLLLACVVGLPSLWGLGNALAELPEEPPALQQAAAFLRQEYQPGDVVLATEAGELNRLRYYAAQAGLHDLDARCPFNPLFNGGHVVHVASLEARDVYWTEEEVVAGPAPRIWRGSDVEAVTRRPPPGMKLLLARTFQGGGNTRYTLALFERNP
jgi:hypothetical protein